MSLSSVPRNDFRTASGLASWQSAIPDLAEDDSAPPRGPGLFAVARANGETAITNIRRLAGAECGRQVRLQPGQRLPDRG